jgi:hypothetical protein
MDDRKSQPLFIVVLLALLGIFTLPRGLTPGHSSANSAAPKAASAADGGPAYQPATTAPQAIENPDLDILGAIIYLTNDGSTARVMDRAERPRFDYPGRQALVREICDRIRRRRGSIHAMIALLPDPVRTSATQDFDSHVDGIERAAEAAGFTLAHHRFPWDEMDKPDKNQGVDWRSSAVKVSQTDTKLPWTPRLYDRPGLLVFRKDEQLLVMFLVLETPTRGLRKHQFSWSLDLLDALADGQERNAEKAAVRSFHVLGPRYTGTALSLNQAIDGWMTHAPAGRLLHGGTVSPMFKRIYRFSIAASATEIDAKRLKDLPTVNGITEFVDFHPELPAPMRPEVVFRSTANLRSDVTETLKGFLKEQFGENRFRIAMLVESNTGLGRALLRRRKDSSDDTDQYYYPLHIASLRASYEKQGLLTDPSGQVFHSAGRLEAAPEENERRLDVVPPATPEFSTRVDELVMVQTMTEIARRISTKDYTAVGIAGSSSLDVIFLARLLNKYAPDAIVFTTQSDLMFTQPQTISDLRGMLIGASYPLYAPNRRWSYPFGVGPKVFFNQESTQAIFNSTTFLLREIFEGDAKVKDAAVPLEFGHPFEQPELHPRPSIWISIVGNRGIYPLAVARAPDPAQAKHDQWLALKLGSDEIPINFEPAYHPFWMILEWILVTLGGTLLGLALLDLWWVVARINRWDLRRRQIWRILEPLASFLVWSRAWGGEREEFQPGAPRSSSGHGPGILLILAQFTFLLIFVTINWPFLLLDRQASLPADGWHRLVAVGFWFAVLSLAISLLAWCILAVDKRSFGRMALMASALMVAIVSVLFWLPGKSDGSTLATYLALERIVAVTSGVSPTFPIVFVGLGAVSFFAAQFKRRYLNEQFSMRDLRPKATSVDGQRMGPLDALSAVEEQIDQLKAVFHRILRVFRLGDVIPTLILAAFLATLIGAGLRPAFFGGLGEGRFYRIVFWSLFSILSVLLAFHVYLVFVIWSHLRTILGQVSRLPLARSFERMPARVARWFFESPTQRNRSAMIQDQAVALAGRCGQVRAALERVISPEAISSREWDALPARLMRINDPSTDSRSQADGGWIFVRSWPAAVRRFLHSAHGSAPLSPAAAAVRRIRLSNEADLQDRRETGLEHGGPLASSAAATALLATMGEMEPIRDHPAQKTGTLEILKNALLPIWTGRPLTWTFAEGKVAEKVQEEAGAGWPILPSTAAALQDNPEHEQKDSLEGVRAWIEMAEDLITLQLLRHLSQFLAQIWVMVRFVVIGSLTLLLAINSYPFPLQHRIGFFLTVLIAVAAAVILRLVIGINRDETISRVGNTMGGFKIDHNLAASMAGYILPLIGILAAASYDMSDLLRVWLDPVFRILH